MSTTKDLSTNAYGGRDLDNKLDEIGMVRPLSGKVTARARRVVEKTHGDHPANELLDILGITPVYGMCTACGAVEVVLNAATGTRDLSAIGESAEYPTGYGCEVCS